MKKFLKIIILGLVGWFLIHSVFISVDGLFDKNENADVAVVFGNKVNEDGTLSKRLKQRLSKGIELYRQKRIKAIIVSGGFGKEGFFEGDKMKEYLLQYKIPASKIIVDNEGNDTEKTVENSIKIMRTGNFQSAISVSQYFHQTRVKKLYKKSGWEKIESASPKYFELRDFYSIFREFVAYYKEAL